MRGHPPDFPPKLMSTSPASVSPASAAEYSERPWPWIRNAILAGLEQTRPHACWGFGEVDVTHTLERIQTRQRELRVAVSFPAFIIHAHAHAAAAHPEVLTYKHGRRLVTFRDSDVLTTIERNIGGTRVAAAYIVRAAQTKSLAQINWEVRQAVRTPLPADPAIGLRRRVAKLPTFVRRLVSWKVRRDPHLVRRLYGTTAVTILQAPGLRAPFWGLPPLIGSMALGVGSITDRLALDAQGRPVTRKHLCLSGVADHAVIDGAPLARYAQVLCARLESAEALEDDAFAAETRELQAAERAKEVRR